MKFHPRHLVIICVLAIGLVAGCHRSHYRRQANAEAYSLIRDKSSLARSVELDYRIDVDPQSLL